jgi:putative lipase involved disintegration of autophagic bodies
MIITLGIFYFAERLSKKFTQLLIFVYQESRKGRKNIHHFIQRYIIDERVGHSQTLHCHGCVISSSNMESVCQIEKQYIFQIISQGGKSTTCTKDMLKVLKEMVILLHMHILQECGRNNSTMYVFLRSQGWGFAVHVLLLNQ